MLQYCFAVVQKHLPKLECQSVLFIEQKVRRNTPLAKSAIHTARIVEREIAKNQVDPSLLISLKQNTATVIPMVNATNGDKAEINVLSCVACAVSK